MRYAVSTSPQRTTWQWLLEVWQRADAHHVFESGWTFDHLYPLFGDSTEDCLEGWITLTALLHETRRLRGGVLVSGMVYRHPGVLANIASTLDITSGGRLELGVGAGLERGGVHRVRHRAGLAARTVRPVRGRPRRARDAADPGAHDVRGSVLPTARRDEQSEAAAAQAAHLHRRQRSSSHAATGGSLRRPLELRRHRARTSSSSAGRCCIEPVPRSAATRPRSRAACCCGTPVTATSC